MIRRAKDLMQRHLVNALMEAVAEYCETSNEDFKQSYILAIGEIGHHLWVMNSARIDTLNKEVNNGNNEKISN